MDGLNTHHAELMQHRLQHFTDPAQRVGATYIADKGVYIRIWAPQAEQVAIAWQDAQTKPHSLTKEEGGYFRGFFPDRKAGDLYFFLIDGEQKIPDPASRHQPQGLFGPSQVVASDYDWSPSSSPPLFSQWVIYEIHPGTFSSSHDFAGINEDLPRLKDLGVTTIEIMPVSAFSGSRNWGYDGVFPHAVQSSYGGPEKLKDLVDACHRHGLAIILDVVYNHLGPEGNVLFGCGPYAQDKYHSPWGQALNYDGPHSEDVRLYFLQAVWQWLTEYRFDGLRVDAVQTIFDTSPLSFLQEMNLLKEEAARQRGHDLILIAETDTNDPRTVTPVDRNGMGFDGQWADDLHHTLHAFLTGEDKGYYADYGAAAQFAKIYRDGFAYDGQYSSYRKRRHGGSYKDIDKKALIVETQNHDQIGNRMKGERLSTLVSFEQLKLAAGLVFLSPFTPFMFMGEEWASTKPFLFFVDHEDPELLEKVRESRREEWKDFQWDEEPPDPADPETFNACVLDEKVFPAGSRETVMTEYYRALIRLSKQLRTMTLADVQLDGDVLQLTYQGTGQGAKVLFMLGDRTAEHLLAAGQTLALHSATYQTENLFENPHGSVTLTSFSAVLIYE